MTNRYFTVSQIEERFDEIFTYITENYDTIFVLDEIGVPTCVMVSMHDYEKMNQDIVSESEKVMVQPNRGDLPSGSI